MDIFKEIDAQIKGKQPKKYNLVTVVLVIVLFIAAALMSLYFRILFINWVVGL